MEKWLAIKGYEGYYEISSYGRVKSLPRKRLTPTKLEYLTKEKIMKPKVDTKGYHRVELKVHENGLRQTLKIHRLVASHFLENKYNKPQINHKDGVKNNNNVDNLEWCTSSENRIHAIKNSLILSHENRTDSKLTYKIACEIRENYIPRSSQFGVRAFSRKYGVSPTTIRQILNNKSYKPI